MNSTYANNLLISVYLFTEHCYLQKLSAFTTLTTKFYYTPDPSLPAGYVAYSAPLKSLVYDSGVNGAYIMNSVSGGAFTNYPITRASGAHFDYVNARVILPSSFGTNLDLTGTASFRQANIYQANESEEEILTQNKMFLNPRYSSPLNSGIQPYIYATPAMFLNSLDMKTEPFQFGGTVNSVDNMSFTILAETNYQLTALLSLLRDFKYQYIPYLSIDQDPLDQWGDFKNGTGFNYLDYVRLYGTPGNLISIENTHTAKVKDSAKLNPRQFAGIADLEVSFVRDPGVLV